MIIQTAQLETLVAVLGVGTVVGSSAVGLWCRSRITAMGQQLANERQQLVNEHQQRNRIEEDLTRTVTERNDFAERFQRASSDLAQVHGRREAERESMERERATVVEMRAQLAGNFAELSAQALAKNSQTFLQLARESIGGVTEAVKGDLSQRQQAIAETLRPISEQMQLLEKHVSLLEQQRGVAYGELTQQVKGLLEAQGKLIESSGSLREETARLASSLRSSSVRGRWGELQLRNVIELAGMVEHCDFFEQRSMPDANGVLQRPDVTVRLPSGHCIAVDAKAPLTAYLDALDAGSEDDRKKHLRLHAGAIRSHCTALSRKAYWQSFDQAPEFVVLFLPGEMFYSAALQVDHELLNWSWEQNVILATPTMLIALLRTVAHGWRAAAIEQNAIEVRTIGIDLHRSLVTLSEHIHRMAKHIGGSVDAYNALIGSFERNVFSKARKFSELKVVSEDLPELDRIDKQPRSFSNSALYSGAPPESLL